MNTNILPKSMIDRAIKARALLAEKESVSDVDDQLLDWVFWKELDGWLSTNGNYSSNSPKEKKERILDLERKREEHVEARLRETLYWSKIREEVLRRDGYTCQMCGKKAASKLHIHHILKKTSGGSDHLDNLITVCPQCHYQADHDLYDPAWK